MISKQESRHQHQTVVVEGVDVNEQDGAAFKCLSVVSIRS